MSQFKAMMFVVENAEHFKEIQEYLFSLGYGWPHGIGKVFINSAPYVVYANSNGTLTHSNEHRFKEVISDPVDSRELMELHKTIVYTITPADKLVVVKGKTYSEKDVLQALEGIKPIC